MDKPTKLWLILLIVSISFGVRLLVWQNNQLVFEEPQWGLMAVYKLEARWLLEGDLKLFLNGQNPPSDTTIIMHPPGYPIFIASVYRVFGESEALRIIQILLNCLSPVFIFLIALNLLDPRTAVISGILAALSPQSAYYAGVLLPDGLSVTQILLALYAFVISVKKEQLGMAALCGVALGISCWFRSNALLLPVFFILFGIWLLPKDRIARYSLVLFLAFAFTIAPMTIRNLLVFHAFIPVSSAAGHNFIAGLADYDTDGRLGLPVLDEDAMRQEAEMYNRPDYYGNQYSPDGIPRERDRIWRGLRIVKANPGWYLRSVIHRGLTYMLRLERVPVIALERDERAATIPILYKLNVPLKALQRMFVTAVFLPLILAGAIILLRRRVRAPVLFLSIVPLYYFCVQSLVHTEYRYVLATPHLLMILAAVTLSFLIEKIGAHVFSRSDA